MQYRGWTLKNNNACLWENFCLVYINYLEYHVSLDASTNTLDIQDC